LRSFTDLIKAVFFLFFSEILTRVQSRGVCGVRNADRLTRAAHATPRAAPTQPTRVAKAPHFLFYLSFQFHFLFCAVFSVSIFRFSVFFHSFSVISVKFFSSFF
jgi:hypothetical protein